jgi:4'-phosphopantetheinyl transferase
VAVSGVAGSGVAGSGVAGSGVAGTGAAGADSAGEPGTCAVWWGHPIDPQRRPGLVALLDDHERDRLDRFRRPADRSRYLAAHALARLVLGHRLGCPPVAVRLDRTCRCGQQHGKPRLADTAAPHFSVTHSGDLVGLAVRPDAPVGLDAEELRPLSDLAAMVRHAWSPAELGRGVPVDAAAFLATWTRKEALLKATGDGLSVAMAALTVTAPGEPAALVEWAGTAAPHDPFWLRDLRPRPGYLAALAGPGVAVPAVAIGDGDAVLRAAG